MYLGASFGDSVCRGRSREADQTGTGLETIRNHEGRHTCGRANQGVVGVFHPGKVGGPGGQVASGDALKSYLDVLVGPVHLAVSLGVIFRGEARRCPQSPAKTYEENWGPRSETMS